MTSFLTPVDPAAVSLTELKARTRFLLDRAQSGAADDPVPDGSFRCLLCRRTFEKGQTDEEALDEYRRRFGDAEPAEHLLCGDCDRIIAADQGIPPAEETGNA